MAQLPIPTLVTKLYVPPPRQNRVQRRQLVEQLNRGLERRLTLVSAAAGFGKTTLVSEWVAQCGRPVAWLSLDAGDNDPARFLTYLIAALQTIAPHLGQSLVKGLQSPQPPPLEPTLTRLVNEIAEIQQPFVMVLDDYHAVDSTAVDRAVEFLIDHLPPEMHLVIVTRQDPQLPLPRLRARGQLNEARVGELQFTLPEASEFFNRVMALRVSPENIAALESRTEGWIAGLQLAALSLQGQGDVASFVQTFTGSHHYVLDYLMHEVLQHQSPSIQNFLLYTSILDRMCASLCNAVLRDPGIHGEETLNALQQANMFLVPLDDERRWYRYHHLFRDLLHQRLRSRHVDEDELHSRASVWFEENGLELEAFQHAAAAHQVDRAARLSDGKGVPLHYSGAVHIVLDWLGSLPKSELDARPALWWKYAGVELIAGHTTGVEEKLQAAEAGLTDIVPDEQTRNLIGQIATARATLALTRYDVPGMSTQATRALEYLAPTNLSSKSYAHWALAFASYMRGDRAAARAAYTESLALGRAAGDPFNCILAMIGLGSVHELELELHAAAHIYQEVLTIAGDQPLQIINEAELGLARVLYEWNDLASADQHGETALVLARQYDRVIDRFILCEIFLARVKLARGDTASAALGLAQAEAAARERNFVHRLPDVAALQVRVLLQQGNVAAAAQLADAYALPLSQARVALAQGSPNRALELIDPVRDRAEAHAWKDEQLATMLLRAQAFDALGETDRAIQMVADALTMTEPEGLIGAFLDEGAVMAPLVAAAGTRGIRREYAAKLRAAFMRQARARPSARHGDGLVEPLTEREAEVLGLIAQGLSNQEISERLSLALITVKGYNQKIFAKLNVQRRTEAVARARELGLLSN